MAVQVDDDDEQIVEQGMFPQATAKGFILSFFKATTEAAAKSEAITTTTESSTRNIIPPSR